MERLHFYLVYVHNGEREKRERQRKRRERGKEERERREGKWGVSTSESRTLLSPGAKIAGRKEKKK